MVRPDMLRARDDREKEARSHSIVVAAERLFVARHDRLPTVLEVARETGIAKGTIYLYFPTKETLFLRLFEWRADEWIDDLHRIISSTDQVVDGAAIVKAIIAYPLANSVVLDLASYSATLLESNIAPETSLAFKARLGERLGRVGQIIAAREPRRAADATTMLLIRSYAYLIGVWQLVELPASLREARRESHLPLFDPTFEDHAVDGLERLWWLANG